MKYKETENEFIFAMLRKNSEQYKEKIPKHVDPGAVLTYPKNYNFIKNLPKPYIKILTKHGWEIDKTIFLEIPYVVTFTSDLDPSLVQVWLTCIPNKKTMFRIVAFTRNYITQAHNIELEDTIIHEQIHIKEDEPKLRRGHSVSVDYDSNEERVERLTGEKLLKKYGPQIYEVDQNAAIFAFKMQQELKTIFFGTLEYWIHRYFTDHFDEYENYAIPMHEKLENDGYLNDIKFVSDNATRVYQNEFNFVLTNLI